MVTTGCGSALTQLPPPNLSPPSPRRDALSVYDAEAMALFIQAELIMESDAPDIGVDERGRRAVELLNQALALEPKSGVLWRYLAQAYAKVPDHREAVVAAMQALALIPGDPGAHWIAGQQLRILGRPDEAEPHLAAAAAKGIPGEVGYLPHYYLYLLRREQGRTDAAAEALAGWAAALPDDRSPHQLRARLLWEARRYEEGLAEAVETLRRAPDDRETRELVAEYHQYDALGEIAVYDAILQSDWVVPEVHDAIRRAYDRLGRFDLAAEHLDWVITLGSHDVVGLRKRKGWLQYRMHDFDAVRATVAELRALHPEQADDPELHELLAAALTKEGRYEDALAELARIPAPPALPQRATAVEKAPQEAYARAARRRIDLHIQRGRPDLAVEAAISARQLLDPRMRTEHDRLLSATVRARIEAADLVAAREALSELRRYLPEGTEEIDILFAEGRRAEGVEALRAAARDQPERVTLVRRLATEIVQDEGLDAALAVLQNAEHRLSAALDRRRQGAGASRAYALDARAPLLYADLDVTRATVLQEAGDFEGAVVALRAALEHRPGDPFALNHLAYLFADRGVELEEALALIRQALEQRPFSGVMQDTYGWILFRSGRYEEARKALETANRYAPREPEILAHLAEVLARLGQTAGARARYQEALRLVDEADPVHRRVLGAAREGLRALDAPAQTHQTEQSEQKRR